MKNPIKRRRNPWMDFLIPSLFLSVVKNHNGRNTRNKIRLGLASTARPDNMPEMKKNITRPFFSAARRDAIKRRVKKIITVGARRIPV